MDSECLTETDHYFLRVVLYHRGLQGQECGADNAGVSSRERSTNDPKVGWDKAAVVAGERLADVVDEFGVVVDHAAA